MPIRQVRDILDSARKFHKELGDFYQRLGNQSEQERVKMLLSYMNRHEKHFDEVLADYEDHASKKILDYWVQFTPDVDVSKSIEGIKLTPDSSVDDILMLAVRMDDLLIKFYLTLAGTAESMKVKEMFTKLLEMEKREKYKVVRNTIRMADL